MAVFQRSDAYEPIIKSAKKFKMSKYLEYFHVYIRIFYVCSQVFRKKRTVYGTCVNKTKKSPANNHIGASQFGFFTRDTKNVPFYQKLMCKYRMSECTCSYFLFFDILKDVFKQ
jgi:hypothetical protein